MKLLIPISGMLFAAGCAVNVAQPPLAPNHPASAAAVAALLDPASLTLLTYDPANSPPPEGMGMRMDDGAMKGMDHGSMKGMDHGSMKDTDQDSMPGMDHGGMKNKGGSMEMKGMDKDAMNGMAESSKGMGDGPMKGMDHGSMESAGAGKGKDHDSKMAADDGATQRKDHGSMQGMDHGSMKEMDKGEMKNMDNGSMQNMEHGAHWMAPADAAAKPNPLPANASSIARGKKLFQTNCASCHGANARGDGPAAIALNPKPADLKAMAGEHPDGDFAWKIANGRNAMPAWQGVLTETQIWDAVNYIKSLGGSAEKPETKGHEPGGHSHQ